MHEDGLRHLVALKYGSVGRRYDEDDDRQRQPYRPVRFMHMFLKHLCHTVAPALRGLLPRRGWNQRLDTPIALYRG